MTSAFGETGFIVPTGLHYSVSNLRSISFQLTKTLDFKGIGGEHRRYGGR